MTVWQLKQWTLRSVPGRGAGVGTGNSKETEHCEQDVGMCGTRGRDWMGALIASRARPKSPLGPYHHLGHLLTVRWLAYDS